MAIKSLEVRFVGFAPLLQNNPRGANPMDEATRKQSEVQKTYKAKKTEENFVKCQIAEVNTKLFWDDDIGVYVPTSWVMASIAKKAYSILGRGYSKDAIRSGLFMTKNKAKLNYDGINKVKSVDDIIKNEKFCAMLILPQGQVRIPKTFPIFHNWSFDVEIEYDSAVLDASKIVEVLSYTAKYNGFGDFRPTYGRATVEVINE